MKWTLPAAALSFLLACGADPALPGQGGGPQASARGPIQGLLAGGCAHSRQSDTSPALPWCEAQAGQAMQTARTDAKAQALSAATTLADGSLIQRQRLSTVGGIALDLLAYASDGLAVGGILCYPDDGRRHSAVIHVHGGVNGIFNDPNGNLVQTCIDWAQAHGRTALIPSLRGEDGGDGKPELCLGEADDVAAAAVLLRSLEVTDPTRVGIVGGSLGGCVVLKASAKIPSLKAVVAFVPPTSWKDFMQYHRTQWQPAVETRCDGTLYDWNIGGPTLADTFDNLICGHPYCSDNDYSARSPLPALLVQSAPTLVMAAGSDNVVPTSQEVLWPLLRQQAGHPVKTYVVDRCAAPGTPASALDSLVYVPGAYHLLSPNTISSGLLFLMQALDGP